MSQPCATGEQLYARYKEAMLASRHHEEEYKGRAKDIHFRRRSQALKLTLRDAMRPFIAHTQACSMCMKTDFRKLL
jgi:hypothetical protein